MPYYFDTKNWPGCTQQGCGVDTFGVYHGVHCARSQFASELLDAWTEEAKK